MAVFRGFYRDLVHTVFVSSVCFFAVVSNAYAGTWSLNYYCSSQAYSTNWHEGNYTTGQPVNTLTSTGNHCSYSNYTLHHWDCGSYGNWVLPGDPITVYTDNATVNCKAEWTRDTTVSYYCGNANQASSYSQYNTQSFYTYEPCAFENVNNLCVTPTGYQFQKWDCDDGQDCVNPNYWNHYYAYGLTCTAIWKPIGGVEITLDPHYMTNSNYSLTDKIYAKTSAPSVGIYKSYNGSNNSYSNQITPLTANSLVCPDETGFGGYYDNNNVLCINSYCELTTAGNNAGQSYSLNTVWDAKKLDDNKTGPFIKLNSSDANSGSHGTEFLYKNGSSWYSDAAYSVPFTLNSSTITPPTKTGSVFAGYFQNNQTTSSQSLSGNSQYIGTDNKLTSAGQTAAASLNNSGDFQEWYAGWCKTGQSYSSERNVNDCVCDNGQDMTQYTRECCEPGYTAGLMGTDIIREIISVDSYFGYTINNKTWFSYRNSQDDEVLAQKLGVDSNGEFGVHYTDPAIVLLGLAQCSNTEGDRNSQNIDKFLQISIDSRSGIYCWCKFTGYSSDKAHVIDINQSPWVFQQSYNDASACEANCARACANGLYSNDTVMYQYSDGCYPDVNNIVYNSGTCQAENGGIYTDTGALVYNQGYTIKGISAVNSKITVPNGYTFQGWTTNSSATSAMSNYSPGYHSGPWTGSSDLVLYAVCTRNTYTATYYPGSCSGTSWTDSATIQSGNSYTVLNRGANAVSTITIPAHKNFFGWSRNSNCVTAASSAACTIYTAGNTISNVQGNLSFYGVCNNDINLIWMSNNSDVGNSINNPSSCPLGTDDGITPINPPSQAPGIDYIFTGWNIQS